MLVPPYSTRREFYKIKVGDDIKALPSPKSPGFKARYKRISRVRSSCDLSVLSSLKEPGSVGVEETRSGKQWEQRSVPTRSLPCVWEERQVTAGANGSTYAYLLCSHCQLTRYNPQPLLDDPSAPLPPPIIPPVESSRPPVYSPEMTALLGSNLSYSGSSPRKPGHLGHPPILPPRADPESSDAKILGPLSKRREVNLRWRYFEDETAKVWPPIEVSRVHTLKPPTQFDKPAANGTIEGEGARDVGHPTPPPVGFQGTSVLRDLESIANPNIPKHAVNPSLQNPINYAPPTPTVNRFIRRQHRKLLGKIPILTYFKHPKSPVGKYEVSLSPLASSGLLAGLDSTVPMADEADLAWLRLPPPPPEPVVKLESPPTQKPKADQNPRPHGGLKCETYPRPQGPSRVGGDGPPDEHCPKEEVPEPKVEPRPKVEEEPKAETRSEVDGDPQVHVKPTHAVRPYPPRLDWTGEPPNQHKHRPRDRPPWDPGHSEDSKRSRRFGGTTGERFQRGELPSHSSPPVLDGVRLFKGSLVGVGFVKPPPKP